MKIIAIPPYQGIDYTPQEGHFMEYELLASMKEKGRLDGVEVDVDAGWPLEYKGVARDDEILAIITVGLLKKVREYSEMGKYDAIVTSGSMEPGFFAARMISKIPLVGALHSAIHVASLIGERFTIIDTTDVVGMILRRHIQTYGLGHKLASVRAISRSSSNIIALIHKYKRGKRKGVPEIETLVSDIAAQCVIAIEEDRADALILGCPPLQCLEDEIRRGLDGAGYREIQLISEIPAAIEMARVMVDLGLIQAPRAYASDGLKAKPKFR